MPARIESALQQQLQSPVRKTAEEQEHETRAELTRIWQEKESADAARDPSLAEIPRFFVPRKVAPVGAPSASTDATQLLRAELNALAVSRTCERLTSAVLQPTELEKLWQLLREHTSPPHIAGDERINYDDFCQVGESMPPRCRPLLFCASHFLKFQADMFGRIPVLRYFQWARRKNGLLHTRAEIAMFDASGEGYLCEREVSRADTTARRCPFRPVAYSAVSSDDDALATSFPPLHAPLRPIHLSSFKSYLLASWPMHVALAAPCIHTCVLRRPHVLRRPRAVDSSSNGWEPSSRRCRPSRGCSPSSSHSIR